MSFDSVEIYFYTEASICLHEVQFLPRFGAVFGDVVNAVAAEEWRKLPLWCQLR